MRVTIFGSGYVGLVTGACLADAGNHVLCVDIDEAKVKGLREGRVPIFEPGLESIIKRAHAAGRLDFTTDAAAGVKHGVVQLIAVGTPPDEDGSADLRHVLTVARTIGRHMTEYRIVVDKSTVPVGTADLVKKEVQSVLDERGVRIEFDVVSNPEFLKEGAAIEDFMKPDRIIIGTDNPRTAELLRQLYDAFNRNHDRMMIMDVRSAELTKYAANAMLATKISFMNELANVAERVGADIESVRLGIGSDPRIGYQFLYAGVGYGGSCFPKDVKALIKTAQSAGAETRLMSSVEEVNERQKGVLARKITAKFGEDRQPPLTGHVVGAVLLKARSRFLRAQSRRRTVKQSNGLTRLDAGDGDQACPRGGRFRGNPRDQRHAVHRRDPGAADYLHDRGAACDRGCGRRSAVFYG